MFTRNVMFIVIVASCLLAAESIVAADNPKLGEAVSSAELRNLDLTIMPNGEGLPDGSGTAAAGAMVYQQRYLG